VAVKGSGGLLPYQACPCKIKPVRTMPHLTHLNINKEKALKFIIKLQRFY
jgi:hypothetical protein